MKLQRAGAKGVFVLYPKQWDKRWLSPMNRRWQTACDMVVGGCSCGRFHEENDSDTKCLLEDYDAEIETHAEWLERQREKQNVRNK